VASVTSLDVQVTISGPSRLTASGARQPTARVGSLQRDLLQYANCLIVLQSVVSATVLLGPVAGPRYHRIEANGPSGAVLLSTPLNVWCRDDSVRDMPGVPDSHRHVTRLGWVTSAGSCRTTGIALPRVHQLQPRRRGVGEVASSRNRDVPCAEAYCRASVGVRPGARTPLARLPRPGRTRYIDQSR